MVAGLVNLEIEESIIVGPPPVPICFPESERIPRRSHHFFVEVCLGCHMCRGAHSSGWYAHISLAGTRLACRLAVGIRLAPDLASLPRQELPINPGPGFLALLSCVVHLGGLLAGSGMCAQIFRQSLPIEPATLAVPCFLGLSTLACCCTYTHAHDLQPMCRLGTVPVW